MAGPLESVWWWPTHRGGVLTPTDPPPSQHEGRHLALLSWHPTPWSRNLADGGAGTPADPGNTVGQVCVPIRDTFRGCVRGDRLTRESFDAVRLAGVPGTRFAATVAETLGGATSLGDIAASVALVGWQLIAGTSEPFAPPVNVPSGPTGVASGYRLASIAKGTQFIASLGARIVPTIALDDAVLTLELCVVRSAVGTADGCDSMPQAFGDVTDFRRLLDRPPPDRMGRLLSLGTVAPLIVGVPPDRPARPSLGALRSGAWNTTLIPPAGARQVTVPLSGLVAANQLAFARLDFSGPAALNEAGPDGGKLPISAAVLPDATAPGQGEVYDRLGPPSPTRYRIAQADWFGRWSDWSEGLVAAAARPRPPRPVPELFYAQPALPNPMHSLPLSGTIRIRVGVPQPTQLPPGSLQCIGNDAQWWPA